MRSLGLLARLGPPPTLKPTMRRALAPDAAAVRELLARDGNAALLAIGRAVAATPSKLWPRLAFRLVEGGGVEVCDRRSLAQAYEGEDLGTIAAEVRAQVVRPRNVLLVVEAEAGIAVWTGAVSPLLRLMAKAGGR